MAALRPALSWDFFHHVYESPAILHVFPDIIYPLLFAIASQARAVHLSKYEPLCPLSFNVLSNPVTLRTTTSHCILHQSLCGRG